MRPMRAGVIVMAALLVGSGCGSVGRLAVTDPVRPPLLPSQPGQEEARLFGLIPVSSPTRDELAEVFVRNGDWRRGAAYERYQRLLPEGAIRIGRMMGLLAAARRELQGSAAFTTVNGTEMRQRLIAQMDLLEGALGAFDHDMPLWVAFEGEPSIGRDDWGAQTLGHAARVESDLAFFNRSSLPHTAFALAAHIEDDALDVRFLVYSEAEEALELRSAIEVVQDAITREFPVGEVAAKLAGNKDGWTNYLRHGYAQYPWESYLNAVLVSSAWDRPPRSQWILVHPEPAVILDLRSSSSASSELGVLVQVAGYVHYWGDGRDWYTGISGTVSLATESELGLGYGGSLHVGAARLGMPNISVAFLHQQGTDGFAMAFGVDVLRLFSAPDVGAIRAGSR